MLDTFVKKYILYDNHKRSLRWLDKEDAPKQSLKPNIHQKKLIVTAWWSSHGVIHYSFMKPGQLITAETYCNQLDNMIKNVTGKQPRLVNRQANSPT